MALILSGTDGISASSGTELFPDGEIGIDKLTTTGTPSSATFLRGDAEWSAVPDPLPSGTKMMFVQTAAPTGWTKSTAHDNKALRVVSGAVSTGGSVAFTTAFASQGVSGTVGSTTLTTAQIPSHNHTGSTSTNGGHQHNVYYVAGGTPAQYCVHAGGGYRGDGSGTSSLTTYNGDHSHSFTTSSTGSSGSHNHSFTGTAINMAVQYVDVIIATKD